MRSGAGRRASGGGTAGAARAADPGRAPGFPPQESTPTGIAELQLSPEQGERRAGAARQLRVLLTPLAVAGRRLPQKRLLGAYGGDGGGGAEGRVPGGKKLCLEPGPRNAAQASPPGTPPAGSPAGNGLDGVWDAESDGSDGAEALPVSARGGTLPACVRAAAGTPRPRAAFPKQRRCQPGVACSLAAAKERGLFCSSQDARL